jgi:MFS family permease
MIFLLVRFVEGVVGSFVLSLLLASVSDIEAEQSRPWMMGLAGAMLALGAGLGMPLGAGGRVDPAIPFLISASLMTVIAFLGISLRDADHLIESSHTTIREFLNLMRLERLLVIPLSFVFIDRFTAGFITASLNLHLRETLGLDPGQAGSMLGLVFWPMGLLSLPVSVLMSRTGAVFLMLVGSVIYGLALALLGWTLNVLEVTSLLAITGIGAALMFVPTLSLVSQWAPRNYRGVAIGSYMGIGSLGFLLGPLASVYMKALLANRLESSQVFPALATIFGSLELLMVVAVFPLIGWIRQREKR